MYTYTCMLSIPAHAAKVGPDGPCRRSADAYRRKPETGGRREGGGGEGGGIRPSLDGWAGRRRPAELSRPEPNPPARRPTRPPPVSGGGRYGGARPRPR